MHNACLTLQKFPSLISTSEEDNDGGGWDENEGRRRRGGGGGRGMPGQENIIY